MRFAARGDGKDYRIKLETIGNDDQVYQYVYTFTPTNDQSTFEIPFTAFTLWGSAPPLDLHALGAITWATIGGPFTSVGLAIDRVALPVHYWLWLPVVRR